VPASRPPAQSEIRRKNLNLDQAKLDRAVELLGARTETDALDQALDLVIFHEEAAAGLRALAGRGHEIENLYDEHLDL
jgi:hypothetical protein